MERKRTLSWVSDDTGNVKRRDLDARERILSVAMQMLSHHGYVKLTIGGVAINAGVGKATIYRSWPNKSALVLDALRQQFPEVPHEDLGDTRTEFIALATTLSDLFGSRAVRAALPGLIADSMESANLNRRLRDELIQDRKFVSLRCLQRAVDRGDLPSDTDLSLVLDSWAGIMLFRCLFFDKALSEKEIESLVESTLRSPHRLASL